MQQFKEEKVTSKVRSSAASEKNSASAACRGKLQCIGVVWQEQIGESDGGLLSFTVALGGKGKTAITCVVKEY